MAKAPKNNVAVITLRGGATHGTALTTTDTSVLATDLKDARIQGCLSGILLAVVEDADDTDGNETYLVELTGRNADTDSYMTLASITVTRGAPGVYVASIPYFMEQLNYSVTLGGSTPSLTFSLIAIATELRYQPDVGTVITS